MFLREENFSHHQTSFSIHGTAGGVPGTANAYITRGGKGASDIPGYQTGGVFRIWGSAIKLKIVKYKSEAVLFQAEAPILIV
jgi:hypothetical protein